MKAYNDETDFNLIDDDFEEFMRRGRAAFGLINGLENTIPLPASNTEYRQDWSVMICHSPRKRKK